MDMSDSIKAIAYSNRDTITLAIDSHILKQIKRDAKSNGQSVNAAINNILTKYVLFYRYTEQQKGHVLTNKSFQLIVDRMEEDVLLNDFESNSMDLIPSILIEQNIPITMENLIRYCFEFIGINAGLWHSFSFYKDDEGYTCLLFRHNYGIKWSKVLNEGLSNLLDAQFQYHTKPTLLPSSVLLKIIEKNM
jgi:hypothetical protein